MAVSEMKKITLLAEKEYLKPVLLSLQSFQAVELITSNISSHKGVVNEYYDISNETGEENEALPSDNQLFEHIANDKEINHVSNQLEEVRESIEFLDELLPSPSFLEKLRLEKDSYSLYELDDYMKNVSVNQLIEDAKGLRSRIEHLKDRKERLEEERNFLKRWKSLNFNPKETEKFRITEVFVGAIDTERNESLLDALEPFNETYIEELHADEDETIYLVISSKHDAMDVEDILIRHRYDILSYDYKHLPQEELKRNKQELTEISNRMKKVDEAPAEYKQLFNNLKLAEEYLFNRRERMKASQDVLLSENLFILTGWIEEQEVAMQIQDIEKRIGKNNLIASVEDVKENEAADVPVKLENNKSASAFENIVEMFGLPKYGEVDPTGVVQFFTILFFGMMTGDAGYGLVTLIGIIAALNFLDLSSSMKSSLKFFGQLMIGTILMGLAYGSFFGFALPFSLINLNEQLIESLVISMGIGIVHLMIGLVLNVVQNNRRGDYAESYISGYSWIMILIGVVTLAANLLLGGPSYWNLFGFGLIGLNLLGRVLVTMFAAETKAAGLGQGLFGLMDITGYVGDILSYTRLTALGVASVNIGMAFNLIVGMLPPIARFTVGIFIFLGLHLFYLFISMISAYVHSLRLNFVEFFGKFHDGGGREFAPISILGKNFNIKNNEL